MKKCIWMLAILAISIMPAIALEPQLSISPASSYAASGENIILSVQDNLGSLDRVWDTYLYFKDSRNTPIYITQTGNTLSPKPLQMLPREIKLQAKDWSKKELVELYIVLYDPAEEKIFAKAQTTFEIIGSGISEGALPSSARLEFVQEVSETPVESPRGYTDYKQWDSRWAGDILGTSSKTIKQAGCAISSAGNIIGWTPRSINEHLKSNGGYVSGNLLVWSKVPNVTFKGSDQISDSHFSKYHVIADLGGHFVLLTGLAGTGKYNSHDPGKSSNPIYVKSDIRGVRLYYK